MAKTALLILTDGAEEMEVVITADVLRRGGVEIDQIYTRCDKRDWGASSTETTFPGEHHKVKEVTYAGLRGPGPVTCSRKTVITPDRDIVDLMSNIYDVVILPGGQPASNNMAACKKVGQVLKAHYDAGKYVAAICAAPIALKAHGIPAALITSHPSVRSKLEEGGYKYSEDPVVVADRVITSRGPGTAFHFALKLVELLVGAEKAKELPTPMVLKL